MSIFSSSAPDPKTRVNLVDLFKPNNGCSDLMYTEKGDISLNIPLETGIPEHHHRDVADLNRKLHSTINHNENIIPPNTLLPSVTRLFQKSVSRSNQISREFDPDIDGTEVPLFAEPKLTNPFEHPVIRGVLSMVMGYGGGCVFALFINAFQNPIPWELQDKMSTKEQLIYSYKDLGKQMKRMGKQMALIGGLYGGIECLIEKRRAKQDIENHVYTGCLTGGILGAMGGPWASLMGCGGFAAFSFVIEKYMDAEHEPIHEDNDNVRNQQMCLPDDLLWI